MHNIEKVRKIFPLWYAQRAWAEELLVKAFGLEKAEDILKQEYRGNNTIPGTNWMYRTHGVGVDIYRTNTVGGIDFDFNKPEPDEWRLRIFFEKQYNDDNLPFDEYRDLYEDDELFHRVMTQVLAQ